MKTCDVCYHEGKDVKHCGTGPLEDECDLCEFCRDTHAGCVALQIRQYDGQQHFVATLIAELYWKLKESKP
jgi:hypothetical protein